MLIKEKIRSVFELVFGPNLNKAISLFKIYFGSYSHYKELKKQQALRSAFDIFNYQELAQPLPIISRGYYVNNSFYGLENNFGKCCQVKNKNFKGIIEHGIYLGDFIDPMAKSDLFNKIITMSQYRKDVIDRLSQKKTLAVGPYIHYFDTILSQDKLQSLKQQLGKTLMVLPVHSTIQVNYDYETTDFLAFLEKSKSSFDTVLVCLYWKDIINNNHLPFLNKGFTIVCAGHLMDEAFLKRLKTFFALSDYVVSNSIGTHIGYAVYMKKPLFLFRQSYILQEEKEGDLNKELSRIGSSRELSFSEIESKLYSLFDKFGEEDITSEQHDFVNYIWGLDQIKSPNEIKSFWE